MTDSVLVQTIENLENTLPGLEEQERLLREQLEGVVQRVRSTREALEHLRVLTGTAAPVSQSSPAVASPALPPEEPAAVEPADSAGQDSPAPDAAVAPEAAEEPERPASVVPQPRSAGTTRPKSGTAKSSPAKKRNTKKATAKKAAPDKPNKPNKAAKKTAAPAKPKAKKVASKRAATAAATAPPADDGAGKLIDAALTVLKNSSVPMRAREINAALGREATPGQIESVRNTLDRVARQQKLVTRPGRGTYAAV
ncbi:hypothetical protein [Streptomyces sp. NRRL S-1448]|uniref:hypothetical protein n=1 Tax=Streptomyces sp. NRRL S-1448 TaxID=1463883 RepID=UPI0004C1675B|nr:hypothetical protein [Streptomyces sp. NRRL S-1448]